MATISTYSLVGDWRINVISQQHEIHWIKQEATRMTMITLCLQRVLLSNPQHELVFSHGKFWTKGGPPCKICMLLPSVYHSDTYGLMCNKCLQDDENIHWAAYWGRKFRTHHFFGEAIITVHVAEFILGTGLESYCHCGECNPNWFLRGWVCYWDNLCTTWQGGQPVQKHNLFDITLDILTVQPFISTFPSKWLILMRSCLRN